jgi:dihydrolipoamide dehydrogenase
VDYNLIVIGSGPGGYHAAIRAAQLGLKTACVEKEYVGGVCLNVGCIPTKALLHVADDLRKAHHASDFGVSFGEPKIDLAKMESWKAGIVKKLTGGVSSLFKGNKVDLITGEAKFTDKNTIKVGDKSYTADKFIVATGSQPVQIPGFETDGKTIVDSTGALLVSEVPKRFMAIGGGAIGLEFCDIYNALGSEATVVEFMDQIVPASDPDAAKELAKSFTKRGIKVLTKTKAISQKKTDKGLEVVLETDGKQETVVVDKLLIAVGRKPNGKGLGLEEIGVTVDPKGYIPVNDHLQTNVPHIYAIGDVARQPLLAHKAMKEGMVAAEHASGKLTATYDTIVPSVVYTSPELASVGMTEKEAKDAGYKVRVGIFPLAASGRAMTLGNAEGIVKVIGDEETDLLLGFHMVGPSAGDMVSEAALAIEMGATLEDISATQHAHPTIAETFMEAAEHAHGMAIHIANKKRPTHA